LIELAAKESWDKAAYISMKGMQLLHLLKLETLKKYLFKGRKCAV